MPTNYEKYFGTPERAAQSMLGANGADNAFGAWVDGGGVPFLMMVGRESGEKQMVVNAFLMWLEIEVDHA